MVRLIPDGNRFFFFFFFLATCATWSPPVAAVVVETVAKPIAKAAISAVTATKYLFMRSMPPCDELTYPCQRGIVAHRCAARVSPASKPDCLCLLPARGGAACHADAIWLQIRILASP